MEERKEKSSKTAEKADNPNGNKASASSGQGKEKMNNYDKKNLCNTESGSSDGQNEIRISLKINQNDVEKDIYFLDNSDFKDEKGIKHYHDNLKELNESNTELYINNKKVEYKKYFKPENEGIYEIILKFNISIKDYSFMFYGCINIENIDFISFNTTNVNSMNSMFSGRLPLKSLPDISNWNTTNVNDMSRMFAGCSSLHNTWYV